MSCGRSQDTVSQTPDAEPDRRARSAAPAQIAWAIDVGADHLERRHDVHRSPSIWDDEDAEPVVATVRLAPHDAVVDVIGCRPRRAWRTQPLELAGDVDHGLRRRVIETSIATRCPWNCCAT